MEPVTLAAAATAALVPYVIESGKEIAKSAGKDLYGWFKGSLTPAGQEALADVEKAPKDADAQAALRIQVRKALEAEPSLAADLARLVEAMPKAGHVQQAKVEGDDNFVPQIIGSGNIVSR